MAADFPARGLAAKAWAGVRAHGVAFEDFGATGVGDDRPAIQRAIDFAVASGIAQVTTRLPELELWEPPRTAPVGGTLAQFYADRTLRVPACAALELDFGGARIALKGPTGGDRFPGQAVADGVWLGGFLTVTGPVQRLRLANVEVDGGFAGDTLDQDDVNLLDKGFMVQDLGDNVLGAGLGMGTVEMENVTLHGFAGEIMYDNCSRLHISRDCHFYNSGHSAWNPSGLGRLVAYNLQAGIARIAAEVIGGKGHSYFGGRFYKAGSGGSTFIGGPDPAFGDPYNLPIRRSDAPPPFVTFHGTRFEESLNFVYLGSYMRGRIELIDATLCLATGFASAEALRDVDLEVVAWADRVDLDSAVFFAGPDVDDGQQPCNIDVRLHCGRTRLAQAGGLGIALGVKVQGLVDGDSCRFAISGHAERDFGHANAPAGAEMPLVESHAFTGGAAQQLISADIALGGGLTRQLLQPTAPGSFAVSLAAPAVTHQNGQRFRAIHDGSGSGDRILTFAKSGAGMLLNADRTLRRYGDYLELEYSTLAAAWIEVACKGGTGLQTIPVLASAMIPNATDGPAPGTSESAVNNVMLATLDFDAAVQEAAQIVIPMPRSWDEGALTIQFVWTAASAGSVVWGCQAVALSDDDPLDSAFGAAQTVTDAVTAAGDVMESDFTAALTVAGAPASEDLVALRFYRDAAAGGDTLAGDARLIAVRIKYAASGEDDG